MTTKRIKRARMSSEDSYDSSMSSSRSSSSSSSEDETDPKDLKPIKEYLLNRKELASQLFKSVKAEKIRMMLPQVLKKMEFSDLEELCAVELTGMSRQRTLSILNGQEMQGSSNTDDSDDSNPSLEIISDTELPSESEVNIKVESVKNNKNAKNFKKNLHDQSKLNLKTKAKPKNKGLEVKIKSEKIKIEKKKKEKVKEKEGESLLDLLELEMRARAIRALIRKEENTSDSKVTNKQSSNVVNNTLEAETSNHIKSRQTSLKEQLEKIDVLMKHGEDEDVYVVINPAPTIELLSSESENEDGSKRINKRLVSERESKHKNSQEIKRVEVAKNIDVNKDKDAQHQKNVNEENVANKEKDQVIQEKEKSKEEDNNSIYLDKQITNQKEDLNLPISVTEDNTSTNLNTLPEELEDGEIIDDDEPIAPENKIADDSPSRRIIKKVKKNPNIRCRRRNDENNDSDLESNKNIVKEKDRSSTENDRNSSKKEKIALEDPIDVQDSPSRVNLIEKIIHSNIVEEDSNSKLDIFDDKALDIDEIINLDDYPDDIDDLERSQATKEKKKPTNDTDPSNKESNKVINKKTGSETWASRYFQQDDVQNVIKESKIQSEIRKRLRERQRQSKLNNSPKLKDQEEPQSLETTIPKPTGSVEEYLALKGIVSGTSSEINEEKSNSVKSSQLIKKHDSLSSENDFTMAEMINITENKDDSSVNAKQVTDQATSVTIVKKPQIFEDVVFAKKVNSLLNENSIVEPTDNTPTCLERINLIFNDKKIIIKEDTPLNRKIVLIKSPEKHDIQTVSTGLCDSTAGVVNENLPTDFINHEIKDKGNCNETTNLPLGHDIKTTKIDSSQNNAIFRMDNALPETKTSDEEISPPEEVSTLSDLRTSELRPD